MVWLDRSFVINTHLDKQDLCDTQTLERQEVAGCKGTLWTTGPTHPHIGRSPQQQVNHLTYLCLHGKAGCETADTHHFERFCCGSVTKPALEELRKKGCERWTLRMCVQETKESDSLGGSFKGPTFVLCAKRRKPKSKINVKMLHTLSFNHLNLKHPSTCTNTVENL